MKIFRLLVALALVAFGQLAHGAISLVQFTGNTASASIVSKAFASNVTAHSTLIVTVIDGTGAGNTLAVTDSLNGSLTNIGSGNLPGDGDTTAIFYVGNSAAGADTVTATTTGSGGSIRIVIHEFAIDPNGGVLDQTATQGYNLSSTSPASGNTSTTTAANELVFGSGSTASTNTWTAGGAATLMADGTAGAVNVKTGTEYQIVSSTGIQSAAFTITPGDEWRAYCFTFKAAAASATTTGASIGLMFP